MQCVWMIWTAFRSSSVNLLQAAWGNDSITTMSPSKAKMFFKCRQKMQIAYQRGNDASKMYFDSSMTLYSIKRQCKWAMFIFSFHFVALDPSSQREIALSCWVTLLVEWILFFWKPRPSQWKLFSRERHYFPVFLLYEQNFNVREFIWRDVLVFQSYTWKCDTTKLSGML